MTASLVFFIVTPIADPLPVYVVVTHPPDARVLLVGVEVLTFVYQPQTYPSFGLMVTPVGTVTVYGKIEARVVSAVWPLLYLLP